MTDESTHAEIESLLGTRQQLQEWLGRLAGAADGMPPAVRDRVRADYEGRLAEVVFELRSHSTVLSGSLDALREELATAERNKAEEEELLAEAEIRWRVGEFDDGAWEEKSSAAQEKLGEIGGTIDRLAGEITRLEEVLAQITPEPEPEPEPEDDLSKPVSVLEASREPAPEPEPVAEVEEAPVAEAEEEKVELETGNELQLDDPRPAPEPIEAPRFTPKGGGKRDSGPARSIRFPGPPAPPAADELAFLKSVTLEGRPAAPAPEKPASPLRPAERPSTTVAKTLKCTDCGAMNRPTEWYCERCGAELAAL